MTDKSVNSFLREENLRSAFVNFRPTIRLSCGGQGVQCFQHRIPPDQNLPDGGGHDVPIRSLLVGDFAVGDVRGRARDRQANGVFLHGFTLAGNQGIEPRFDETGTITAADPLERVRRKPVCRKQFHERVVVQFPHSRKRLTDLT